MNTEGFACPNQQCAYCGNTGAQSHALVEDGKHGQAEPIQTFRGPACRTTFSARRDTPLYRLKTPSRQVAMVLSALAEGLDASAAERVAGLPSAHHHQPFSLAQVGMLRSSMSAPISSSLAPSPPVGPLLRTRLRCATQVLRLWLAMDPCTKIVPVLRLGPRTQHMAHMVLHFLRQTLAAFLHPALYQ